MPEKRINIDLSGFERKMKSLKQLDSFYQNITEDAADYFLHFLVDEQLNAPENVRPFSQRRRIVRRISGNLARSFGSNIPGVKTTQTKGGKIRTQITIVPQANVAEYGPKVFNAAKRKTGRQPLEWTQFFQQKRIKTIATKAFKSGIQTIAKGGSYRYKNPYPALRG